jgi:hypothetical protein
LSYIENQDEEDARLQVFNPRSSARVQACQISGGVCLHTVWLAVSSYSKRKILGPGCVNLQILIRSSAGTFWEERDLDKALIVTWLDLVHFIPCSRDLDNFGRVGDVHTSVVDQ